MSRILAFFDKIHNFDIFRNIFGVTEALQRGPNVSYYVSKPKDIINFEIEFCGKAVF